MEKILVCTDVNVSTNGNIDELSLMVPELVEKWKSELLTCCNEKRDIFEYPAMKISKTNSKNFQVIGMLYNVVRAFQKEHSCPEQVKILCPDDETAKIYRVVYNFYIPRTKDDRMADSSWD